MKINAAWWADKKARLPIEPEAFDYGDTARAILELSGIPNAEGLFREAVAQLVSSDATLRNSALNNIGYGLLAVRADVRQVIADALFAVKDPAVLPKSSPQPSSPAVPASSTGFEKMIGDVDSAAERIIAQAPPGTRTSSGRLIVPSQAAPHGLSEGYLDLPLSGILALFDVQQIAKDLLALGAEGTTTAILPAFWHRPLRELLADAPRTFEVVLLLLRQKELVPGVGDKPPVTDTPAIPAPRESRVLAGDTHQVGTDLRGALRASDIAAYAADAAKKKLPAVSEAHQALSAEADAAHAAAEAEILRMKEAMSQSTSRMKANEATTGLPPEKLKELDFE